MSCPPCSQQHHQRTLAFPQVVQQTSTPVTQLCCRLSGFNLDFNPHCCNSSGASGDQKAPPPAPHPHAFKGWLSEASEPQGWPNRQGPLSGLAWGSTVSLGSVTSILEADPSVWAGDPVILWGTDQ